jgi:ubiquinone/menaquinone biosynthesis C-methylase UbiE
MKISPEIETYYNQKGELNRLGRHSLERLRTQEIISRYLLVNPVRILDAGGATGVYALWLSELGHQVHLIDPVLYHCEETRRQSALSSYPLESISLGEAGHLDFPDNTFDIVLMLGPLYHLPEYPDRIAALQEALRVACPGGVMLCAVITRLAAIIDGFFKDFVNDPHFIEIMMNDASSGKHLNPTCQAKYFTTAYFHRPDEIKQEIISSGWDHEKTVAIESFAGLIPAVEEKLSQPSYQNLLLNTLRVIEEDISISGIGGHLVGIGRKKEKGKEI